MDAAIASETDLNAIIKEVARENLYHCVINYYFFNLFLTIQLNAKKFYYLLFFFMLVDSTWSILGTRGRLPRLKMSFNHLASNQASLCHRGTTHKKLKFR